MREPGRDAGAPLSAATTDLIIRLGLLGLLAYWSFKTIAPLLTIVLWSAVLAVALYPIFDWLARRSRHPRLAAALVTLLCLMIVIGPVTWLALGLVAGAGSLVTRLDAGLLAIPRPGDSVKDWPLIGERIYQIWTQVASNIRAALVEIAPTLKPLGLKLLTFIEGVGLGLLQFMASIIVAGFLLVPGPRLVNALRMLVHRIFSDRSEEMIQLAGTTIRNVARGVVGIALLQSILAGVGFLLAGIPAPGVFAFIALLLGIIQIGAGVVIIPIVIWSWMSMDAMQAFFFTLYMVPVGLIDNVLRPILVARGLSTPTLVIVLGVIGGTLAYGLIGLFFGPIVLSVAWALICGWVNGADTEPPIRNRVDIERQT